MLLAMSYLFVLFLDVLHGKEPDQVNAKFLNYLNSTVEIQWPDPRGAFTDIHLITVIQPLESANISS